MKKSSLVSLILTLAFAVLAGACGPKQTCYQLTPVDGLRLTAPPSNKVSVLFQVTDACNDDNGVAGLQASDFTISEDSAAVSEQEGARNIVKQPRDFKAYTLLLLDFSGSVLESGKLKDLVDAANAFVQHIFTNSRNAQSIGVYWFDGQADIHALVNYTSDENAIHTALNAITAQSIQSTPGYDRSTDLFGSIIRGLHSLDVTLSGDSTLIKVGSLAVFTDGRDRAKRTTLDVATTSVNESNNKVFTIGIDSPDIVPDELNKLGKDGSVLAKNIDELIQKFTEIADRISGFANSFYLLEYCSPARNGDHLLTIETPDPMTGKTASFDTNFSSNGFKDMCTFTPDGGGMSSNATPWEKPEGGALGELFTVSAVSNTQVLTAGFSNGQIDSVTGVFTSKIMAVAYNKEDGAKAWKKEFSPTTNSFAFISSVFVSSDQNVIIGGIVAGSMTLDSVTLTTPNSGGTNPFPLMLPFVAKLSKTNGAVLWAKTYGIYPSQSTPGGAYPPLLAQDPLLNMQDTGYLVGACTGAFQPQSGVACNATSNAPMYYALVIDFNTGNVSSIKHVNDNLSPTSYPTTWVAYNPRKNHFIAAYEGYVTNPGPSDHMIDVRALKDGDGTVPAWDHNFTFPSGSRAAVNNLFVSADGFTILSTTNDTIDVDTGEALNNQPSITSIDTFGNTIWSRVLPYNTKLTSIRNVRMHKACEFTAVGTTGFVDPFVNGYPSPIGLNDGQGFYIHYSCDPMNSQQPRSTADVNFKSTGNGAAVFNSVSNADNGFYYMVGGFSGSETLSTGNAAITSTSNSADGFVLRYAQ